MASGVYRGYIQDFSETIQTKRSVVESLTSSIESYLETSEAEKIADILGPTYINALIAPESVLAGGLRSYIEKVYAERK